MGFTLDKIVPWGRSYDEYVSMFGLTKADLGLRILGCGDGPAGFIQYLQNVVVISSPSIQSTVLTLRRSEIASPKHMQS